MEIGEIGVLFLLIFFSLGTLGSFFHLLFETYKVNKSIKNYTKEHPIDKTTKER